MKLELMGAAVAAAALAASAPAVASAPQSLFWSSFAGAALSALWTVKPAFLGETKDPPSRVAFRAFVSLTSGFCAAFYFAEFLISALSDKPPISVIAFVIAFGGERSMSFAAEAAGKLLHKGEGK